MISKMLMVLLMLVGSYISFSNTPQELEEVKVVKKFSPVYPPLARVANISKKVVVEVEIDKDGTVQTTRVREGHPLLNKASEQTAKKWTYSSSECDVENRKSTIIFSFKIMPDGTNEKDLKPVFIPPNEFEIRTVIPLIQY